jgi:hypothetical protein
MITDKQFNGLAQKAHVFGGLSWIWGWALFFPAHMFMAASLGISLAAFKEFFIDYIFENSEERGSSAEDFSFYCIGMAVALASYYLKIGMTV